MKRNPHIIVQQVCPVKKIDNGKYEVQAAIVHHKGIIARFRMEYPTKRHARWAQHLICAIYCITSRHAIIVFVPRMPCMEKRPTMPGSRLENGKIHNKRA